jgi:protease I
MNLIGKDVAILVSDYFEQAEFEVPIKALKDADATVVVISSVDKKLHGLHHVDKGDVFTADLLLEDAIPDDYDALVLPGGAINADALRMNKEAQSWVKEFLDTGKPLAAICHAPWLLVSADVLDGRKLTSYYTIQDDISNAGGEWLDQQVVIDQNLITSRQPDDLPAFSEALIAMLNERPITEEADDLMVGPTDQSDELDDEYITDPEELHPVVPSDKRDVT